MSAHERLVRGIFGGGVVVLLLPRPRDGTLLPGTRLPGTLLPGTLLGTTRGDVPVGRRADVGRADVHVLRALDKLCPRGRRPDDVVDVEGIPTRALLIGRRRSRARERPTTTPTDAARGSVPSAPGGAREGGFRAAHRRRGLPQPGVQRDDATL